MKKFFVLFAVLSLVFAGTAIAGPGHWASTDAGGVAGGTYDANGYFLSGGKINAKVNKPVEMSFSTNNVAGALSGQKVTADGFAGSLCPRRPYQSVEVYGEAGQASAAFVNPNPGTWAYGSQTSGASFNATDHGFFTARAEGKACTVGGTLVGAARFDTRRSSTSVAGAVTGSMGSAYAGCDSFDTDVWGSGYVEHGTYANKGAGEAWTYGDAAYSYNNDGRHHASGGGLAATVGYSNVRYTRCGVTAAAKSLSFSTFGPTNASGGVHINTFDR